MSKRGIKRVAPKSWKPRCAWCGEATRPGPKGDMVAANGRLWHDDCESGTWINYIVNLKKRGSEVV